MTRYRITQGLAASTLAAAMLVLGSTPALAQPADAAPDSTAMQHAHGPHGKRMTPEQRQQRMAEHQARFKQKLQITPDQEGAWKRFTDAMQPSQHARLGREDLGKLSTPERIDRMRALRSQRAAEMDRRGDAVKAFYAALTPAQQKTFDAAGMRMRGARQGHAPRGHAMHPHPQHNG